MKIVNKSTGKELSDAKVIYTTDGVADTVQHKGVMYDVNAFDITEDKETKKTKPAPKTKQKVTGAMTSKDLKTS